MDLKSSLICLILCVAYPTDAILAQSPPGMGILGDSLSDEYESQSWSSKSLNWVEQLHVLRGVNLGLRSTDERTEPRRSGFEFNWARGGDIALGLRHRQLPGILTQVADGKVSLVFLAIGGNDLSPYRWEIHDGRLTGERRERFVSNLIREITTAVDVLLSHNVAVVLGNINDILLPPSAQWVTTATGRQRMADIVTALNARIRAIANDRHIPLVDIQRIYELSLASELSFGGQRNVADVARLPCFRGLSSIYPFRNEFGP